ncbi:hypothetical protein F0L68_34425 [Solihabitans fulvus]|uniref:Uncharacterized protein n=1 Tax=Solihabitans fulvus TaxID=1892852 RepID=A0A5B2WQ55_9PSEU|nr:hypothetical protein [Solihabitans fulvus]KAA2252862.1 hypothetical protein F0L68_34425 [Solihabitans fulvus]
MDSVITVCDVTVRSGTLVVCDPGYLFEWEQNPERTKAAAVEAANGGGGAFHREYVSGVAIPVPRDRSFLVQLRLEPDERTPSAIELVLSSLETASEDEIGPVSVDCARVIFADAEGLTSWKHEEPLDGLADVAFWGRHKDRARQAFGGDDLPDGTFGWSDLPVTVAVARLKDLQSWVSAELDGRGVVADLRPHSDHYRLLESGKASPWGAGQLTVGGELMCGVLLESGDGQYPVTVSRSADNVPTRLQVHVRR